MKYAPYSASKLGTFNQCNRKFKYKYIDKIPVVFKPSEALTKGSIVHSFLENHELSTAEKIQALKKDKQIINSPFYTKALIKVCFEIYTKYVASRNGNENFNRKTLGNELTIALNKKLEPCEYMSKDVLFRGYIDRITVDTTTDIVYVGDYKTGKDKSIGPYKQPFDQLIYYAAWYFSKFPIDKIILHYDFVEHTHKPMIKVLTRDNVNKYKKFLLQNIVDAEKCQDFNKTISPLCDWCDYQTVCENDTYGNLPPEIDIDEDDLPF